MVVKLYQGTLKCRSIIIPEKYLQQRVWTEELEFLKDPPGYLPFDDITHKGITQNFNTKPNEKAHWSLKKSYQLQTNFKDVAKQVGSVIISESSLVCWLLGAILDLICRSLESSIYLGIRLRCRSVSPDHRIISLPCTSNNFHIKLGSWQCTYWYMLSSKHI